METADLEARESLSKLWVAHREFAMDYWGPDKQNGKRSVIVALTERVDELERRLIHYMDSERRETCLGLEEFDRRDKAACEEQEEDTEVKVANIQAEATLGAADKTARAATWREWIILIGVLASVVVSLIK